MRTQELASPRSRAPRGSLSEERITSAALTLLARDGLDGLTMRAVGAELGVGTMSLYRHVRSRAALVELVRSRVLGGAGPVAPRASAPWPETLRGLLHDARARLRRHPGAVVLFHSDGFRQPPHVMEGILGCLGDASVPASRLASTSAALWAFTVGSVLAEQSPAAAWPGEEIAPPRRKAWVAGLRGELAAAAPRMASTAAAWSTLSHDEVFAEGLELLLRGLDRT